MTETLRTCLAILVWASSLAVSGSAAEPTIGSCAELQRLFRDPPCEYRPAPLWVWHDKVSKEMIDRDLEDLKAQGFGGQFIHPRYGLITEYLSDEWFGLVEHAHKKAKQLGLRTWIYDENSFPSGFAGGHVPDQMPESYKQGQGLVMRRVKVLPDDLAKYLVVLNGEPPFENMTGRAKPGDKGNYCLFEKISYAPSKWHAGFPYVDLLVPGVTDKFIEVTMRGYERVLGDDFGTEVPGVFTDEPNIRPPRRESIRWTPSLFDEFQKRWGYDLAVHLPSLFEEVGDWRRVRHNHYQLLLELFIKYWSVPWNEYTEKHNLQWTGHYWEHGWPNPEHGGDNMAMYAWHQTPAIDMLFNTMDQDSVQFGNIRAVKELRSVANQMGRHRTLSETYGAAGWELRFEDMKRLGDWQYVLGVNFLNQHLTYMNLTGDRKHDFPQGISYQTPWWKHYKVLNDYFSRLSVALSRGRQENRVLVLVPTSTTWMYYSPVRPNQRMKQIGDSFHTFLTELEDYHIEYDLGCENIIARHGRVEGSSFTIGACSYDYVVLPPDFENLDGPTFELLRKFVDAGGHLWSHSDSLALVDGQQSSDVAKLRMTRLQSVAELHEKLPNVGFEFTEPDKIPGNLLHMRRRLSDGELVFLANSSLEEKATGTFTIRGSRVVRLDAVTGKTSPYPATSLGDAVKVAFEVAPTGSLLLFISPGSHQTVATSPRKPRAVLATPPSTIKRLMPNMLTLDYCVVKVADKNPKGFYFYAGGIEIWKAHGYRENPWVSSVQWKSDLVDADNFARRTGFDARYHFRVDDGVDRSSLKAVVEQPNLWKIQINGKPVKAIRDAWAIDKTFGVFDIGPHAKQGTNEISVTMRPMSIYAELAPVYVTGDFGLASDTHGWHLIPSTTMNLGSWKQQGLPYYPYDVAYTKTVEIPECREVAVTLGDWNGTVAEVRVNGKHAGIIGWKPYELDVTKSVRPGFNTIDVIVTGSFKNLLGPHHNVQRRGIVTPWSFKSAPKQQPAGNDYDLLDYGLVEDYSVMILR